MPRLTHVTGLTALAGLLAVLGACAREVPPPPGLEPEPLGEDGRLPPGVEAMIFGSARGCRDDLDCESNACVFGTCAGLLTADEPWRMARIGARLRERLARQPELADTLTALMGEVATKDEMGLPFRGRVMRALGQIWPEGAAAPAIATLRALLPKSPAAVAEVAAVTLARLGDASGADLVIELAHGDRLASACDALEALGHIAHVAAPGAQSADGALPELLATLSPGLDLELQRAALDGLGAARDPRAIRPLVGYLTTGPEPLADRAAEVLRQTTGQSFGPDALAWDRWLSTAQVPAPPAFVPRGTDSSTDIDLPTP